MSRKTMKGTWIFGGPGPMEKKEMWVKFGEKLEWLTLVVSPE